MTWVDPRTWVALEKVSASKLQTIRDALKEIGDPWTAYTPTWTGTGLTVGNATLTGGFIEAGKLVIGRFVITVGSTTVVGSANAYSFGLPVTAISVDYPVGSIFIRDTSAGSVRLRNMYNNTTTTVAGQDEAGTFVSGSAPFALANTDVLRGTFVYEAA